MWIFILSLVSGHSDTYLFAFAFLELPGISFDYLFKYIVLCFSLLVHLSSFILCVCMWGAHHSTHSCEVRLQLVEDCSLFPPCGFWRSDSYQAWQQAPLLPGQSGQPSLLLKTDYLSIAFYTHSVFIYPLSVQFYIEYELWLLSPVEKVVGPAWTSFHGGRKSANKGIVSLWVGNTRIKQESTPKRSPWQPGKSGWVCYDETSELEGGMVPPGRKHSVGSSGLRHWRSAGVALGHLDPA